MTRDVVFTFNTETWDDAVARGMSMARDRLAGAVLADDRIGRRIIANPFRSPPQQLARLVRSRGRRSFPRRRDARLVTPARMRRADPLDEADLRRSYQRYDRRLAAAARVGGLRQPAVITSNPFVAAHCELGWASSVTFYVTDDWAAHPARERWWPAYRHAYSEVRRRRRRVCAVSAPLLDRIAPTGRSAVVPNGIDADEWSGSHVAPAWFRRLPRPRLLYVGNLQDRVDVAALDVLAASRPDATVVLVGPLLDQPHFAPLTGRANVVFHDRVGRGEVVALIRSAEACLVPHRRSALTEAMSPLKLYEYLAGGRPVAAIDLPPMRVSSPQLVRYREPAELPAAVERALAIGPAAEPVRAAFVEANAWPVRHETLLDVALEP